MKLASDSHQKLEEFFREYYQDDSFCLPAIQIYCGKFTQVLTKLINVHGITFGSRIYILPDLISRKISNKHGISEELAAHEIAHSLQYKKHGFIGFFYKYLSSYLENLKKRKAWDLESRRLAYLEIPFEIEAREIGERFALWNSERRLSKVRQ